MPPPIFPTYRFSQVEPELYRGGYPKERNVTFLKRLQLKTMISLTPKPISLPLDVNYIHIKVDKPKEEIPLMYQKVNQILGLLLDASHYPVYIHCLDGQLVTSMIMMCLRKLMLWDMNSIKQESLRFLKEETVTGEQQEFVEKYPGEFEVTSTVPSWFSLKKHPTLKYKQNEPEPKPVTNSITNLERSSIVEETRLSRTIMALDLDIRT
jgi:hypothetical protein